MKFFNFFSINFERFFMKILENFFVKIFVRILKCIELSPWTTALEKPHLGCAGTPFMKTTTSEADTSESSRDLSSGRSGGGRFSSVCCDFPHDLLLN